MLENVDLAARIDRETYKQRINELQKRLGTLQREAHDRGIPVVAVFEGWDASGKGTLINRLMLAMDARGFTVHPIGPPTEAERLRPFLWRFWLTVPAAGRIAIYDRSWYGRVLIGRVEKLVSRREWTNAYDRINSFEQQLTDGGYCVVKFFLHIDRKEQKKRFRKLESREVTAWKVGKAEWKQHKLYAKYAEATEDMLGHTSTVTSPWTVIAAHSKRVATLQVFDTVVDALDRAMASAREHAPPPHPPQLAKRTFSILDRVDLGQHLERPSYTAQLKALQRRIRDLEHEIYVRRVGVAIVYEGWDAAGKGGNIRRLVQGLDPRGYEVIPIAAPTQTEKARHYLWRFWVQTPKAGHITIFDRSWYGRVLVERVEGFCSETEWMCAYEEIKEMERQWTDFGMVIVKFWLHISADEQLARFEARQENPHKQWKITDEDWRNREKWQQYESAVEDMLFYTGTPSAPWTVVESNDKLHARTKALRTVIQAIETRLD